MAKKFKALTEEQRTKFVEMAKDLLHESRDNLRIKKARVVVEPMLEHRAIVDPKTVPWDINDPYYAEVYGMFRTLETLGFGSRTERVNDPKSEQNLTWWFQQITDEVLKEEGFRDDGKCELCFKKHGHDDARPRISA